MMQWMRKIYLITWQFKLISCLFSVLSLSAWMLSSRVFLSFTIQQLSEQPQRVSWLNHVTVATQHNVNKYNWNKTFNSMFLNTKAHSFKLGNHCQKTTNIKLMSFARKFIWFDKSYHSNVNVLLVTPENLCIKRHEQGFSLINSL